MNASHRLCPVCGGAELRRALERRSVPVNCVQLWPTAAEARAIPRAEIHLECCTACGYVWNSAFDPARVVYSPEYDASLHFSPRFQRYVEELVDRLARELDLRGRCLLEIGCGKGEFLDLLCRRAGCRGVGYDTSFSGEIPAGAAWTIERRTFGPGEKVEPSALVASRHVLEHVVDPLEFLRAMRGATVAEGGAVFLEVPNGLWVLRDLGIWDVIYEHVSLFTPLSLAALLRRGGLEPRWLESAFEEQYLRTLAVPEASRVAPAERPALAAQLALVERFASAFRTKIAEWSARLRELAAKGGTAALWGAGAKGATFLSCVEPLDAIRHVVDINPRKVGRHVPGSGHRVEAPEALRGSKVELLLVMNAAYVEEIRARMNELGFRAEIACV